MLSNKFNTIEGFDFNGKVVILRSWLVLKSRGKWGEVVALDESFFVSPAVSRGDT